jgi:miniconductance mechanosensitive channel
MASLNNADGSFIHFGTDFLIAKGVNETIAKEVMFGIVILGLLLVCWLVDFLVKKILNNIIKPIVQKSKTKWDDVLLENRVFKNAAHIPTAIVLEGLVPIVFSGYPAWIDAGIKISVLYFAVAIMGVLVALLHSLEHFLENQSAFKDKPIESYLQLGRLLVYLLGGIYLVSLLFDQSPWKIFSALGAMSVVLILVFRDTILGFVASIQMSANNMVKMGDWVEFPKYGADGNVIEIKLQTVKIRNWDKTITTVPTYAFVSEAFKNWRGMEESGGRRIKRSIIIDMTTIRFCDEELLDRWSNIKLLRPYLESKRKEVAEHNQKEDADLNVLANGRRLTNIGTFRAYIEAYLNNKDVIHKDLTFLVRQLQSTEKGLPIEIYVFSKEQRWAYYEAIQADIFDHLFAIASEFDLSVFQSPTGKDFKNLIEK